MFQQSDLFPADQIHDDRLIKIVKTTSVELKISRIIRQIDPTEQHFIVLGDECPLSHEQLMKHTNYADTHDKIRLLYKGYYVNYGGITLEKYFSSAPKTSLNARILNILKQLTKSINILWENDIIHNDIKADNIVIDNNDIVRIIDFGLSWFKSDKYMDDINYSVWYPWFMYITGDHPIESVYTQYEYLFQFFNSNYTRNTDSDYIFIANTMLTSRTTAKAFHVLFDVPYRQIIDIYMAVECLFNYVVEKSDPEYDQIRIARNKIINPYTATAFTIKSILTYLETN